MIIKTKRLVLRPLEMKYLNSTYHYSSDVEITKYMRFLPDLNIQETKEMIIGAEAEWKKPVPRYYEFVVLCGEDHVGAVSVYREVENGENVGELGWIIAKEHWGNGYAYEAAKALIDYSLTELKMNILTAHCDSANIASYKLMEKLGMKYVSRCNGRYNKTSDEEREEFTYEIRI